jgi:hypothetical protein
MTCTWLDNQGQKHEENLCRPCFQGVKLKSQEQSPSKLSRVPLGLPIDTNQIGPPPVAPRASLLS